MESDVRRPQIQRKHEFRWGWKIYSVASEMLIQVSAERVGIRQGKILRRRNGVHPVFESPLEPQTISIAHGGKS
jgi:hypothetical protein